jgi:hypothetical protein
VNLGPSELHIGRKFHGSMPSIINTLTEITLEYNDVYNTQFYPGFRCAAYAFDGSRLIAAGINKPKTHTILKSYYNNDRCISIHAEADLIIRLLKIKSHKMKAITDVVVIRGTQNLLSSKPCINCQAILHKFLPFIRVWWFSEPDNIWNIYLA